MYGHVRELGNPSYGFSDVKPNRVYDDLVELRREGSVLGPEVKEARKKNERDTRLAQYGSRMINDHHQRADNSGKLYFKKDVKQAIYKMEDDKTNKPGDKDANFRGAAKKATNPLARAGWEMTCKAGRGGFTLGTRFINKDFLWQSFVKHHSGPIDRRYENVKREVFLRLVANMTAIEDHRDQISIPVATRNFVYSL